MDCCSKVARQPLIDYRVISDLMTIGHSSLLIRVIRLFKEHVPNATADIERAIAQQDRPLIVERAHALKSILASLGARQAFNICHELEAVAKQEKTLVIAQCFQCLRDILQPTMTEVISLEAIHGENVITVSAHNI